MENNFNQEDSDKRKFFLYIIFGISGVLLIILAVVLISIFSDNSQGDISPEDYECVSNQQCKDSFGGDYVCINHNCVYSGLNSENKKDLSNKNGLTGFFAKFLTGQATGSNDIYYTAGNVGIGTTSPDSTLDVGGKLTTVDLKVTDDFCIDSNCIDSWDDLNVTTTTSETSLWTMIGSVIYYNGNVGIGTAGPQSRLHIEASNNPEMKIKEVMSGGSARLSVVNGAVDFYADSNTNQRLTFSIFDGSNKLEAIRITQNGNVGIGTSSPSTKLEVSGTLSLTKSSAVMMPGSIKHSSDNYLHIMAGTAGVRFFNSDGTVKQIMIDTAGNVGIGTTNPSAKLDIVGEVKISDTFTGTGSGVPLCIGTDGKICKCGNCAEGLD